MQTMGVSVFPRHWREVKCPKASRLRRGIQPDLLAWGVLGRRDVEARRGAPPSGGGATLTMSCSARSQAAVPIEWTSRWT